MTLLDDNGEVPLEALYGGAAGGGKDLWVGTPVLTMGGWKTMGDLAVGDAVIAGDGSATTVIAVSEIFQRQPCFRLVLEGGISLIAGHDHRWLTVDDPLLRERLLVMPGFPIIAATAMLRQLVHVDRCPVSIPVFGRTDEIDAKPEPRRVVAVEPIPSRPTRCIMVNHPSGTFLVGRELVVTHNSEAMLMAAAQYVEVPGYSALLLRRTFPDLNQPGAILERSKQWWSGRARWVEDQKAWHFPSGSVIKFGHIEHEKDKYDYQGAEYQFIGFDELSQFTETMYRYLFSRLRRKHGIDVPLRMRAASNPGGIGHEWVKQRFIVEGREKGRYFLPAGLKDNPSLNAEEYLRSLENLDPITRAQLIEGDWDIHESGGAFSRAWFSIVDLVPSQFDRLVRAWDIASTPSSFSKKADWTVGLLMGAAGGRFFVLDLVRMQGSPQEVERAVLNTAIADGHAVEIIMEQEPGASGKIMIDHYATRVLSNFSFQGVRTAGDKLSRARPISSQAQAGNVSVIQGPWLSEFFEELEMFPHGRHDDVVDALTLAYNHLTSGGFIREADPLVARLFSWRA